MTEQPKMLVTFEDFLAEVYPIGDPESTTGRATEIEERKMRMEAFPYDLVLQLAYPQMDFANQWCWEHFGPEHGECQQRFSEYPVCREPGHHTHEGQWLTHWLAKTDYDFGFNEWYFAQEADRDLFLKFVPNISWGENYSN
jgi:hypothetical protein